MSDSEGRSLLVYSARNVDSGLNFASRNRNLGKV